VSSGSDGWIKRFIALAMVLAIVLLGVIFWRSLFWEIDPVVIDLPATPMPMNETEFRVESLEAQITSANRQFDLLLQTVLWAFAGLVTFGALLIGFSWLTQIRLSQEERNRLEKIERGLSRTSQIMFTDQVRQSSRTAALAVAQKDHSTALKLMIELIARVEDSDLPVDGHAHGYLWINTLRYVEDANEWNVPLSEALTNALVQTAEGSAKSLDRTLEINLREALERNAAIQPEDEDPFSEVST
jgi:hypothetical protein